jgi:P2 family phage contractile tail tube protein
MSKLVPQVLQDVNIFVDGKGYLGVASSLKLPDITQETVEVKGGIGAKYATGAINAMEASFTLKVADVNLFLGLGLNTWQNRIPVVIKASIFQDGKTKPVLATITGDWEGLNLAAIEPGKEIETEIKMQVHFYSLDIDNTPVIVADVKNMICMIGGVDYLADMRSNLL